jgi:hypothetical protein
MLPYLDVMTTPKRRYIVTWRYRRMVILARTEQLARREFNRRMKVIGWKVSITNIELHPEDEKRLNKEQAA